MQLAYHGGLACQSSTLERLTQRHPDSALPTTLATLSPAQQLNLHQVLGTIWGRAPIRASLDKEEEEKKEKKKKKGSSRLLTSLRNYLGPSPILPSGIYCPVVRSLCPLFAGASYPEASFCVGQLLPRNHRPLCGHGRPTGEKLLSVYSGCLCSTLQNRTSRVSSLASNGTIRIKTRAFIVSNLRGVPLQPSHAL